MTTSNSPPDRRVKRSTRSARAETRLGFCKAGLKRSVQCLSCKQCPHFQVFEGLRRPQADIDLRNTVQITWRERVCRLFSGTSTQETLHTHPTQPNPEIWNHKTTFACEALTQIFKHLRFHVHLLIRPDDRWNGNTQARTS